MTATKAPLGCDLAIIGGGLIGSAIGWGAARHGARVVVLDEGDIAHRASRGNFGLVWLQGKGLGAPDYMHWSVRAGRLWPELAAILAEETGIDVGWRGGGGLHFCCSDTELDQRHDVIARSRAAGANIEMRVLDRAELLTILPGIGPQVVGASWSNLDGEVNPMLALRALQQGLCAHGGRVETNFTTTTIAAKSGGGFVITSRSGQTLETDRLVIAAGLGANHLGPQVGITPNLRPERGQILVTDRFAPFLPMPTSAVRQTREGTVLLGSTHEDAGFSTGTEVADWQKLCHIGARIFPALRQARVMRAWGALRIMSPDGLPIYAQSPGLCGAFLVTCHSGVTLASLHALHLGPALAEGHLGQSPDSMRSTRFDL